MLTELAYKKEFVLSSKGNAYCLSMLIILIFGLFIMNTSFANDTIENSTLEEKQPLNAIKLISDLKSTPKSL